MKGRNPVPLSSKARTKLAQGSALYEDFTGHEANEIIEVNIPRHSAVICVGQIDAIEYTTVRDGVVEEYRHDFRKKSRPLLTASHDGSQLYVIGGHYIFTERGIEDLH